MTDETERPHVDLAKAGRAYTRAQKVIREDFPDAVRRAHFDEGKTYAQIARETEHAVTPERVRQILNPKPKAAE